uniref:Uncharacterized protein n=1 Tax=Lepeophtheirus salmonis TaxID=72036 RepID=A0A0K2UUX4_LEPSM
MKHTHTMLNKAKSKCIKLGREKLRLIVQTYTGHVPFLAHLRKWKDIGVMYVWNNCKV